MMRNSKNFGTLPPLDFKNQGGSVENVDVFAEVSAEVTRADALHGPFPTIQHAAAVLRREGEEVWAEVWGKPVNRAALRMELLHVEASARRFIRLLDEDPTTPKNNAKV